MMQGNQPGWGNPMSVRAYYNLVLMVLWIGIAVILLAPEGVIPDNVRRNFGGSYRVPAGVLAITFAVYNAVRWWSYRMLARGPRGTEQNPLAVRTVTRSRNGEEEPNPDFDFTGGQPHPPTGPSTNGDHRG